MTEVLGEVLSTQTLGGICAREYLGAHCLAGSGYDCTCRNVRSVAAQTVQDGKGAVFVLAVELMPGVLDTKSLVRALQLTGYRADWTMHNGGLDHGVTLEARWDLWRPENRALRDYLAAS